MLLGNCVCHCDRTPPVIGNVRRKLFPTFIADYEGIATHTWTAGTNKYTATFTASVGDYVVLAPIRWVVYGVTAASQRFDLFARNSAGDGFLCMNFKPYSGGPTGLGAVYGRPTITTQKTVLPVSGNSHMTLESPCRVHGLASFMYRPTTNPSFSAVDTQTFRYRTRVNGVGGTLRGPQGYKAGDPTLDYADFDITIAEGDTFEFDVWHGYRVNVAGTYTVEVPTGVAARGASDDYWSLGAAYAGAEFNDVYFPAVVSDGFDPTTHHYTLSFTGGDLLTFVSSSVTAVGQTWTYTGNGPAMTGATYTVYMDWDKEIPTISISGFSSVHPYSNYSPADSGDYINTTTFPGLTGTQLWKQGCFDWSGTTTFSQMFQGDGQRAFEGRRSGTPLYTDPWNSLPTSISVTYAPL